MLLLFACRLWAQWAESERRGLLTDALPIRRPPTSTSVWPPGECTMDAGQGDLSGPRAWAKGVLVTTIGSG